MVTMDTVREELNKWVATRSDEIVFNPQDGFYPYDMLIDAYKKGRETGEESFKLEVRERFYENAQKVGEGLNEILRVLNTRSISPKKLLVNHSINTSSILLTIEQSVFLNKDFIKFAYEAALEIQKKYSEINLHISFMDDVPDLNIDLLKADGFGFIYDLPLKKQL